MVPALPKALSAWAQLLGSGQPRNRKQPRGGKENRYAAAGSRGLSTVLHRHVPTVACRPAVLRWPLRSPSVAVAEPTDSGTGTRRAQPGTAAASRAGSTCTQSKGIHTGERSAAAQPTPGLRSPLSILPAPGTVPSDREGGQPSSPIALAGHPSFLAVFREV